MAKLTGAQYEQLQEALLSAYPRRQDLRRMLMLKLDKNLDAEVEGGAGRDIVFNLIGLAEAQGWTDQLVGAAKEQNPGNPDLAAIGVAVEVGAKVRNSVELEVMVSPDLEFLDVATWADQLPAIERRLCAIELNGKHRGTGFLVGPDVVMTNRHVVAAAIASKSAKGLIARFDWGLDPDTEARTEGTVYEMADDWLVDESPHSEIDRQVEFGDVSAAEDELDYAMIRLAPEPTATDADAPADRGWITVPRDGYVFEPESFLMIAQHPCGADIKMAIDPRAVTEVNGNATRVRYRTNTQPGSSGSPCFNSAFELVALHHAGRQEFEGDSPPDPCEQQVKALFNQGVPIKAIVDLATARGTAAAFGE